MITVSYNVELLSLLLMDVWFCHLVILPKKTHRGFCDQLGKLQSIPGMSCGDIYQFSKASRGASGNYWINTTAGVQQVYCDMELECGGHK